MSMPRTGLRTQNFASRLSTVIEDNTTVVNTLLIKETLDKNEVKNYPPVFSLLFIFKLIAQILMKQLFSHFINRDLNAFVSIGL